MRVFLLKLAAASVPFVVMAGVNMYVDPAGIVHRGPEPLMAAMILAGALGNWLGEVALDYTSEVRFRLILQLVLTALGLRLIWMAVPELGWF